MVVQPHLGRHGLGGRNPVDRPLHLAAVGRVAAARGRIVGAVHFDHLARLRVFHHARAADEIGIAQPHFLAGGQAMVFLRRDFAEVVLLDLQLAREGDLARAHARVFRVVDRLHLLDLAFRVVVDHDLQRPQHAHHPRRPLVQVGAQAVLQQGDVDHAVDLRHADGGAEACGWPRACSRGGAARKSSASADRPSR